MVKRSADMQYLGQMHDIAVPIPLGKFGPADEIRLREAFYAQYKELFHRVVTRIPVEALTWRVTVSAAAPHINLRHISTEPKRDAHKSERLAYFGEQPEGIITPVYDRYALCPGDVLRGPAIIEERESTFVVGPGAQIEINEYGSLVVQPPKEKRLTAKADKVTEGV